MARRTPGKYPVSIADLERQALEFGRQQGREALERTLRAWIDSVEWPRRLSDGYILKEWRRIKVSTVVGTISLRTPYYWRSGGEPLPVMQAVLGLSGRTSPELARIMGFLAAELPFTLCQEQMQSTMGLKVSHMTIRDHALELGRAAQKRQTEARLPRAFGDPARMTVEIDGGRINTDEGWREPRLARVEVTNARGEMLVFGLSRLASAEVFWSLLTPLLVALKIDVCKRVAFLSDGATWILDEAKRRFPQALCILDFYHAAEHIHDAAKAIFKDDLFARTWARKWTKPLKRGRIDYVLNGLQQAGPRLQARGHDIEPLARLLAYLEPRRDQLLYATARRRGFRIGSGRIEALVKQAVNLRLKRNGAWWNVANAEAILALRLAKLTGHLDRVWQAELKVKRNSAPSLFFTLLQAHPLPRKLSSLSPQTRVA